MRGWLKLEISITPQSDPAKKSLITCIYTVVQCTVNDDLTFLWEYAIFKPREIKTHSPSDIEFWNIDCFDEISKRAKFS